MQDHANSSIFNDFLNSDRDVEERTASGKPFQTQVAAAEKLLPPMVARQVHEIAKTVDDHLTIEETRQSHSSGHKTYKA